MQNKILTDCLSLSYNYKAKSIQEENMKNSELLSKMTLEEKVSLCSGKDMWYLRGIE